MNPKPEPMFWKKEFAWSYSTVERLAISKSKQLGNIFREYARYCTVHGVQYIFKDNSSLIERCAWLVIVLTSFVCASMLVHTMWLKFNSSPTVTAVKDTHLALYSLPFPAVNVCPMDKIKRSVAYKYVADRINVSYQESELDNFLNVLTLFQHPLYSRMLYYLNNEKSGFLPKLTTINITDFMLHVLPTCNEVFNACYWIGHSYNCCDLFSLQRSEEGFCYSFNSLTSVKKSQCPMFSTLDTDTDMTQTNSTTWECVLRRNTAAGSTSGLQIFFKQFNKSERLINASIITGQPAVRVQVFYVNEYPESGMGSIVTAKKGTKLSIMVKPFVTISTDRIKHLPLTERFCYFPDEQHLSVSKSYTQKSCLIECRLNYLHRKCGCRPYYFNMLDNRIPICNSTQLLCIAQHNSELRFYSPPIGNTRGFQVTEMKSPLNCSQCLPTCHESVFDLDVDYSLDSLPLTRHSYGSVDIFYRNEGAVKYERDVTFGWIDLLVSFGGIAGLFLGFSLLTIIEFVYWGIKFLIYQYNKPSSSNKITPKY
ncbi:sodium channel protein Nach-like [Rhopalosiphum padi]|uniref:sodium channel protein Nach-like n=1 Tax=Rhopalosiphum padi TaxID=40932 RepID=UPI00298E87CB|nr:sodium channel protein Nach-like [Rhopalosiphum padi]